MKVKAVADKLVKCIKEELSFKDFSITESDKTGMLSIYFKNIGFDGLEVPVSSIIYLFETNAVLMSFILPKVKEGISLDKIDEVLDTKIFKISKEHISKMGERLVLSSYIPSITLSEDIVDCYLAFCNDFETSLKDKINLLAQEDLDLEI